jgi:hypothetical protein
MAKVPCKYGSNCYRKNPEHKAKYSHPNDNNNNNNNDNDNITNSNNNYNNTPKKNNTSYNQISDDDYNHDDDLDYDNGDSDCGNSGYDSDTHNNNTVYSIPKDQLIVPTEPLQIQSKNVSGLQWSVVLNTLHVLDSPHIVPSTKIAGFDLVK